MCCEKYINISKTSVVLLTNRHILLLSELRDAWPPSITALVQSLPSVTPHLFASARAMARRWGSGEGCLGGKGQ